MSLISEAIADIANQYESEMRLKDEECLISQLRSLGFCDNESKHQLEALPLPNNYSLNIGNKTIDDKFIDEICQQLEPIKNAIDNSVDFFPQASKYNYDLIRMPFAYQPLPHLGVKNPNLNWKQLSVPHPNPKTSRMRGIGLLVNDNYPYKKDIDNSLVYAGDICKLELRMQYGSHYIVINDHDAIYTDDSQLLAHIAQGQNAYLRCDNGSWYWLSVPDKVLYDEYQDKLALYNNEVTKWQELLSYLDGMQRQKARYQQKLLLDKALGCDWYVAQQGRVTTLTNENYLRSNTVNHLVFAEDYKNGRLKRKKDESMCGISMDIYKIGFHIAPTATLVVGGIAIGDVPSEVTCKNCLRRLEEKFKINFSE